MRLLFEIGMEENPARFLVNALNDLKNNLSKKFKDERIKYEDIKTFGTPRRLVILVEGLAERQEDLNELNMGPAKRVAYGADGSLSKAGLGFAKSQGVEAKDLEIVETPKGEYIAVRKFSKGVETKSLLSDILKNLVLELEFPKSMKWADRKFRFARPIQWFLAIVDNELVKFEIEGIESGLESRGHRFFGGRFTVSNVDEYFTKIRENNVIIDIAERKQMIRDMIAKNCTGENEVVLIHENLLDEVTNLVEYPYPIVGTFNSDFLEVPQEVLIISMEVHQRYFPILDKNGKLLPKFVVIRNGIEYSDKVKAGNEKVLSARLADARFFYQEDLKQPLVENVKKLETVVFQKDLGTIAAKIRRVSKLADTLIDRLGYNDVREDIQRTITLCKADLVTNMINEKEFTELQGLMGADYALKSGEKETVSLGIQEHYFPRFKGDKLPTTKEGIVAGICDRMDTLVGCLGVGVQVTGSKDPFALRRAALGIVNVIINSNLNVSLEELVDKSIEVLEADGVLKRDKVELKKEVLEFLKQRVINVFTDMGYRRDVILSVVAVAWDNVIDTKAAIEVLESTVQEESFKNLVGIVKRVGNIVKAHKDSSVDVNLFNEDAEKSLYNYVESLDKEVDSLLSSKNYKGYLNEVLKGEEVVNNYFNNVMINDKDEAIKNNRLSQMKKLNDIYEKMADLNLIEG
ncbi:MAG: glycine--tRNA ligase subunit beta [Fusobacterium perfoetens]|uniref:glycine--tRNA ligase subunit beta n=1 Tax=Fusobacterium perfoetens TaxID=852 RepID=UPI0023F3DFE5|nr:glycine--tRNA ligase subunit beta [Fusobacterium perfoetens]MCI6152907.1 glycine--tRNA ligase subunit beta [Fusobacterium perfoetens]MDY3237319.1 glycine--tRNA ligase subunit beta [Fusobacterium perfoetens]